MSRRRRLRSLFDDEGSDHLFQHIRESDSYERLRSQIDGMWSRFEPFADRAFRSEFRKQIGPRYWEMHLACKFLDLGFKIESQIDSAADFLICSPSGLSAYVEAVSPEAGVGPDAVQEPMLGSEVASAIDHDPSTLRFCGALEKKRAKRADDVAAARIDGDIPFVVAINSGDLWSESTNHYVPLTARACLGVENMAVRVDSGSLGDAVFHIGDGISKQSGAVVPTNAFVRDEFKPISAILHGHVKLLSYSSRPDEFELLHNHLAVNPLPRGWLASGTEYWFVDRCLHAHSHRDRDADAAA